MKYTTLLDKRSIDQIATIFNGVVGKSLTIERLVIDIKDDLVRSVTNRLAYLLMLSNEEYSRIGSKELGLQILNASLSSLVSRPS